MGLGLGFGLRCGLAHLARGLGEGEVTAAVGDVTLLAERARRPLAATELRNGLSHLVRVRVGVRVRVRVRVRVSGQGQG